MRACNSQPSEPFIYWGLKSYRSTFNDISQCKKNTHPGKKHKKHSSPSKKASHRKKAQSTRYNPCEVLKIPGFSVNSATIFAEFSQLDTVHNSSHRLQWDTICAQIRSYFCSLPQTLTHCFFQKFEVDLNHKPSQHHDEMTCKLECLSVEGLSPTFQ